MAKGFIKFLGVVAVLFTIKFVTGLFAVSAKIHAKNMLHTGWDNAKPELRKVFEAEIADIDLEPEIREKYLDCVVNKAINFLNHTVCSYAYNTRTTSKQEHLQAQDACIEKTEYAVEILKFSASCAKDL